MLLVLIFNIELYNKISKELTDLYKDRSVWLHDVDHMAARFSRCPKPGAAWSSHDSSYVQSLRPCRIGTVISLYYKALSLDIPYNLEVLVFGPTKNKEQRTKNGGQRASCLRQQGTHSNKYKYCHVTEHFWQLAVSLGACALGL
jgi:hypothetical protein